MSEFHRIMWVVVVLLPLHDHNEQVNNSAEASDVDLGRSILNTCTVLIILLLA